MEADPLFLLQANSRVQGLAVTKQLCKQRASMAASLRIMDDETAAGSVSTTLLVVAQVMNVEG